MTFDDFLPLVLPYVPGCADLVVIDHARRAARKFIERTGCWTVFTPAMTTIVDQATYPLVIDEDQERVKLVRAWVDGCEVPVVGTAEGQATQASNYSRCAYLDSPQFLGICPKPRTDGLPIVAEVLVKPSLAAIELPDEFAEFVDDIAHGAIATLSMLPSNWKDLRQAELHGNVFAERINTVGFKVSRSYSSASPARRRSRFL